MLKRAKTIFLVDTLFFRLGILERPSNIKAGFIADTVSDIKSDHLDASLVQNVAMG